MVVFTCNHCGESLKKQVVDKHAFRCRQNISVSCMDCFKDFDRESYNGHLQCMTELQRYSGKDYVPKANANKGQKKQEAWVDIVRSITEKKTNISSGVSKILETISSYENIPRKKAKFLNFMKNSFRYMKVNELEEAWSLLEEAMKESKAEIVAAKNENAMKENGSAEQTNGKRKLLVEESSEEKETNSSEADEPPKKKKKKRDEEIVAEQPVDEPEPAVEEEIASEKFSWGETIRNYLSAKNNEVKLSKLRGKLVKKYKNLTGSEWSDKVESKFNKKINKLKGIVVDNERVRLIAS